MQSRIFAGKFVSGSEAGDEKILFKEDIPLKDSTFTTKFEGHEKKLEIILSSPQPNLRSNIDGRWDKVVNASGAAIVSHTAGKDADAYILSESSLFVWDDSIVMITCGQTALVNALPEILNIVDRDNIAFLFYERKNLMFPQDQPSDFEDEAARLSAFFPGKSYTLGSSAHDHMHVFYWARENAVPQTDAVLRILMNDLDPDAMEIFFHDESRTPAQVGELSGLYGVYHPRHAIMDSFIFSPCGYSMNGLVDSNYFTVHITPEPEISYASFETSVIEEDYPGFIQKVLSIFKPGKFSLALTTTTEEHFLSLHSALADALPNYKLTEKNLCPLDAGYAVSFLNYRKL